jgi:hypothetical protein
MADQTFDFSYEYTRAFATRLARRELLTRHLGFLISLAFFLFVAWALAGESDLNWLSGFFAGIACAFVYVYIRWYRRCLATAAPYAGKVISVHLNAAGLRLVSPVVASEVAWSGIVAVRRTPEALLIMSEGREENGIPIPSEALSPEAMAFVVSSVAAAGGRVESRR